MTNENDTKQALEGLRQFIYETTHLSAQENDGSHWCKISKECLEQGRKAYYNVVDAQSALQSSSLEQDSKPKHDMTLEEFAELEKDDDSYASDDPRWQEPKPPVDVEGLFREYLEYANGNADQCCMEVFAWLNSQGYLSQPDQSEVIHDLAGECQMCDGMGFKDYAALSMEPCECRTREGEKK